MNEVGADVRSGVRLLLIRCAHSESYDGGVARRASARGLSPTGRSQAVRLGKRLTAKQSSLEISRVYSTRVPRAAQTAAVVADVLGLAVRAQLFGPAGGELGGGGADTGTVIHGRAAGELGWGR
ncbi:histidine phosphatase family protein [Nocardia sp. NPDC004168]|uniref:histidine phosphatase family protein n=1 Tax=Nocardia sp. NPDC004168 TaxID=3154452 RepID=UPI0033AB3711